MRKFRDIIESPFPVPTNALWLKGSDLKGFINGKWVTIGNDKGKISWNDILDKPEFATVATSGSYNDLSDKPDIPSAYTLPTASATILGGVKSSTTGTTSGRNYNVQVNADGTMKVNVPWTDTVYSLPNAATSVRGGVLMAAAVTDLAGTEDAAAICTKVNALLAALRTAGILTA